MVAQVGAADPRMTADSRALRQHISQSVLLFYYYYYGRKKLKARENKNKGESVKLINSESGNWKSVNI